MNVHIDTVWLTVLTCKSTCICDDEGLNSKAYCMSAVRRMKDVGCLVLVGGTLTEMNTCRSK